MAFFAAEVVPNKPSVVTFGTDTMAECALALRSVSLRAWRKPFFSCHTPLSRLCSHSPTRAQATLVRGGPCRLTLKTLNHTGEEFTATLAVLRPGTYENHAMNTAFGYDDNTTLTFAVEPIPMDGAAGKGLGPPCVHLTGFLMKEVDEEDEEDDYDGPMSFVRYSAPS